VGKVHLQRHHPLRPGRLRRHQQPAGDLLPLQRRQARRLFAYARGRTDFRGVQASHGHREAGCVFCALEDSGRVLLENELALCIADAYPVSEGHSLVIPRRHGADGLELHQPEWNAVVELLKLRREQLVAQDATISGWNVGVNSDEAAGQTVFHAYWHLIPRRLGDCEQPKGGVRVVITGKQGY
jgi:diadenosine tetraphosphate (Ap4A) HIT family hydrolase